MVKASAPMPCGQQFLRHRERRQIRRASPTLLVLAVSLAVLCSYFQRAFVSGVPQLGPPLRPVLAATYASKAGRGGTGRATNPRRGQRAFQGTTPVEQGVGFAGDAGAAAEEQDSSRFVMMTFQLPGGELREVQLKRRPVGVEFDEGQVPIRIKQVLPESHGEELGIQVDWLLFAVNGTSVVDKNFDASWAILSKGIGSLPGTSLQEERVRQLIDSVQSGDYKGLMKVLKLPEWAPALLPALEVAFVLLEIGIVFFAARYLPAEWLQALPLPENVLCTVKPDLCSPQ